MKKIIPILAGLFAVTSLAACGGSNPAETDEIVKQCLNKTLVFAGSDVLPGLTASITGDNTPDKGSMIQLVTRQKVGEDFVDIEWDYAQEASKVYKAWAWDDTHTMLEMNFPAAGAADDTFHFTIKNMKVGNKVYTTEELEKIYKDTLEYEITLKADTLIYDPITVADICKVNDAGTGYEMIDYSDPSNIYFKKNYDQKYFYATVKGKVIYMTDDFNWGILADGDAYTEVYFGGSDASRKNNFPALAPGKYVEVRGDLGQYKGNIQFSFINRVRELTNHDDIKEPGEYKNLTAEYLNSLNIEGKGQEYVVEGFMNSLASVTGTFIAGTLDDSDATSITTNARHTFKMQVGDAQIKIAYDYHVSNDASAAIISNLNKVFAGGTHTIKGTIRYEGSDVSAQKGQGTGVWTLVPFLAEHVA